MYGPASGTPGNGDTSPRSNFQQKERTFTPKGQMSGGANQRPPLQDLPPHLRVMFEPNPPLEFKPPVAKRESKPYTGISTYKNLFEKEAPPPRDEFEPPAERKKRIKDQLIALNNEKLELMLDQWKPKSNPKATENAYSTLFVGRLSYDSNDKKLKREFEQYGAIKTVKVVVDGAGKPRGYAFVEYEKEGDVAVAFKRADGKKLDGRRIVVDVERGRTVRNWKPRRFGGGLGGRKALRSKKTLEDEAKKAAAGGLSGSSSVAPSSSVSRPSGGGSSGGDSYRSSDRSSDSRHGDSGGNRDRDRGDRPERSDRGDRPDRSDRGDRDSGKYGPASGAGLGYSGGSSGGGGGSSSRRSRSRDRGDRKRDTSAVESSRDRDSRDSKRYR